MSAHTATSTLVDELIAQVGGTVLGPDAPEAAEESTGFQLGVRHRPGAVVAARTADDVRTAARVVAEQDLPVTVQHTGHGTRVPADGGILLLTAGMDTIDIDAAERTARIGAGAVWGDVTAAADAVDLMAPSGSSPGVGAIGYTFGGGLGLTGRTDGWAVDHVRAFEIVDRVGDLREVTTDTDPDRFARLRGTGPAAGEVVTAMTIGLLPAGPLTGGALVFDLGPIDEPGDAAPLHTYRAWTADLPDAVTSGMSVVTYPDWDVLPPHLRGRRIARIAVTVRGDAATADALLAPLRAATRPAEDTVGPLRPVESSRVYAEPEMPHAYTGENLLLDDLAPAGLDAVAALDGPMTVVGIRHLGGALGRPAAVADTVSGRDAAYLVGALSPLDAEQAVTDPASAVAAVDPSRALRPFGPAAVGTIRTFGYGPRAA
ncbi:FAD binding domain-containing protein [Pseudonocardia sediminis]|uniref:FAD binding domain-containing protein n=1 Tax=Pseudonocardia sediminis TaxID=1397368 RepID=A0A4Q7UWC3_PSEST|nr:FAD-binding protein [Pseudonocardia sediminis]RZT86307.1 FAD binding domain-containing protein [Pseudonocardia sediminis]